jgi:hypothetical protein
MAIAGTTLIISQLSITPGPQFKHFSVPLYLRVALVGSVLIRRQSGVWAGVLAGLLSPVVGVVLVNPFFIFVLGEAPVQFAVVGLITGLLVWVIARSKAWWLKSPA